MVYNKHYQYQYVETKSIRIPVIIANMAYDIYTSATDDNPTTVYNPITIYGVINELGIITYPDSDEIQEYISKHIILGHRLKRFVLEKSSFQVVTKDPSGNIGFGHSHNFGTALMIYRDEPADLVWIINQTILNKLEKFSLKRKPREEVINGIR